MKPSRERFAEANNVLRGLLQRLARGAEIETVSEGDLNVISGQISDPVCRVGEASYGASLDSYLQREIAEYVRNFRALQEALERARCLVAARKLVGAR